MASTPALDVVALVQVTFTGLALLVSAIGGVYAAIAASRAKRAEEASKANDTNIGKVQDDVKLIERNTNSMTTKIAALAEAKGVVIGEAKGVAAGEEKAATLAEGQRQGREAGGSLSASQETPVPVVDDKVTAAIKSIGSAVEESAKATEHVAIATEKAKK